MNAFLARTCTGAGLSSTHSRRIGINRSIKPFIAILILIFAGKAYAVIDVDLLIMNGLDSNGNITVIEGDKVKVAYEVVEDTDKDLHKNDKIQLLRVSDDSVVASTTRGNKKSGKIFLKIKNSVDEDLYVRYVRKGQAGTEIARTGHPDDGDNPVKTIAKASIKDLTIGQNALKYSGQSLMAYSVKVNEAQHLQDVGLVPVQSNRVVNYVKQYDNSLLKVTFNDNLRAYNYSNPGNQAACLFHIYFNDEACTVPGSLQAAVYTRVSNATNPHHQRSLIGVCSATAGGPILAGPHEIRVYVAEWYDGINVGCYLGWNSTSTLMVEELP